MFHFLPTVLVAILILFVFALLFLVQGPPYAPSSDQNTEHILQAVEGFPSPRHILDFGSGDGKLVLALAWQGYRVTGIELNPLLVIRSRRAIRRAGLSERATIVMGNFWRHDTSRYDLVVMFVIRRIMPRLERKLKAELKAGTPVVSNFFVLPNMEPVRRLGEVVVYRI